MALAAACLLWSCSTRSLLNRTERRSGQAAGTDGSSRCVRAHGSYPGHSPWSCCEDLHLPAVRNASCEKHQQPLHTTHELWWEQWPQPRHLLTRLVAQSQEYFCILAVPVAVTIKDWTGILNAASPAIVCVHYQLASVSNLLNKQSWSQAQPLKYENDMNQMTNSNNPNPLGYFSAYKINDS